MINGLREKTNRQYNIDFEKVQKLTNKTYKVKCINGNCFVIKKTELYISEKYDFLKSLGVDNVLYPIVNNNNRFVSSDNGDLYYVMNFVDNKLEYREIKANKLKEELMKLHFNTSFKKELSVKNSRKKMEDIYEYLQYKFNVIEIFIRSVEARPFDEYSIIILKNYYHILDAKKIMAEYQKKLIKHIKEGKSVNYSFVHNNPKLSHIVEKGGNNYLISLEKSKVGIPSLDIVKLYLQVEDIDIDKKEFIMDYFNRYDDEFYFDYFCFFVLFYYIKGIIVNDKDYVSSQSFLYAASSIKKFITTFDLLEK